MDDQNIRKYSLILSLSVIMFCVFSYFYIDIPIAIILKSTSNGILNVFEFITKFGVSTWYLVFTFVAFVFFKYIKRNELYYKQALFVFLAISTSGILVNILKVIFGRYRPVMFFDQGMYAFTFFKAKYHLNSFPSGHSDTIAALALALYFIYPKYRTIYIVAAILVAASRVILGVHFVSDVVFGAYLGIVTTILLKYYYDKKGINLLPESVEIRESVHPPGPKTC